MFIITWNLTDELRVELFNDFPIESKSHSFQRINTKPVQSSAMFSGQAFRHEVVLNSAITTV